MSALVASAAQATAGTLTTEGKTGVITAEQTSEHEVVLTDHPVSGSFFNFTCKKSIFPGVGTVTEGATSVRVHPEYSECTRFGQPVAITTTGCDYVLKTGTPAAGAGWHVTTDIVCAAGSVIKFVTGTCEFTIGEQTGLTTSEATNSGTAGTAMDILLHINITGFKYTVTKDSIGCSLSGLGSFSKGDYTGTTTVRAHDSVTKVPVGITLH
jgi:hypothetical protein